MSSLKSLDLTEIYEEGNCDNNERDAFTASSLGEMQYFLDYDNGKRAFVDLTSSNQYGWTPLMYACSRGHALLVNFLVQRGVSKNCKSKMGVTPLMLSISSGDITTVKTVFDIASLEEKDFKQWTALFYAVFFARDGCVDFLMNKGANVDVVDKNNETPLMAAVKSNREEIVKLIVKRAKNLEAVSSKNKTVFELASETGNSKIQKLLFARQDQLRTLSPKYYLPEVKHTNLSATAPVTIFCTPPTVKKSKSNFFTFKRRKGKSYSPNSQSIGSPLSPNSFFVVDSHSPTSEGKSTPTSRNNQIFFRPNDVESFLNALGLGSYWPIFRDEEVDFETLLTLNEDNLREVGIKTFGPRRKIYLAIQNLLKTQF